MKIIKELQLGDKILTVSKNMHIAAEYTERGLFLQDIYTKHKILIPLDKKGYIDESKGITEGITPVELCEKGSFRIMDVPAKEYKGKHYRMVMCCIKGYWNKKTKRCKRPYFVIHAIVHPPERSLEIIKMFLSGKLTRLRERTISLISPKLG